MVLFMDGFICSLQLRYAYRLKILLKLLKEIEIDQVIQIGGSCTELAGAST